MTKRIKTVIVTNVPAPYRVPVWRRVAADPEVDLSVIFCSKPHIDTQTAPDSYGFKHLFLTAPYLAMQRRFMHCDLGIWGELRRLNPDLVITTGYIPTFLFAFAWSWLHRVKHVVMTDGTLFSEQTLTPLHRIVRRWVFKRSQAFIGACQGSAELFRGYGIAADHIHIAYLCADNSRFGRPPNQAQSDFIFCGRFIPHKQPLFALRVAEQTARKLGRKVSLDFLGDGEMLAEMRQLAQELEERVTCRFLGYASQEDLPQHYANAKVFLFPTAWDPWGVVANEACAAGLPVIVSPHAGVAGELVLDNVNGYIRELETEAWSDAAARLLTDAELYARFSANSRDQVAHYTYDASARGMLAAIKQAAGGL